MGYGFLGNTVVLSISTVATLRSHAGDWCAVQLAQQQAYHDGLLRRRPTRERSRRGNCRSVLTSLYTHSLDLRCCESRLTVLGAAIMLSVRRDMRALRYLALMSRIDLIRSAAQGRR
jgi:hypothetical protein